MRTTVRPLFLAVTMILAPALQTALSQQLIATVPVGTNPNALAVEPTTNRIYVVNGSGTVTVIDGNTNAVVATLITGGGGSVAANPVTHKVYIGGSPVTVIDEASLSVTNINASGSPLAVNTITNKIYCIEYGSGGGVAVIDGTTNEVTTISGVSGDAISLNPVTNKIYVGTEGALTVIDGATNGTTYVNLGGIGFLSIIAINPVTNRIWAVDVTGKVFVIDGTTLDFATIYVGASGQGMAIDSLTNRAYATISGGVVVIDGNDLSTTPVQIAGDPYGVNLNEVTNKIYVSDYLGGSVTMIDGATLSLNTVAVGSNPTELAVNTATNRIYVSNYGSDTVSVIAGASAPLLQLVPVPPCRLVDTRQTHDPVEAGDPQAFIVPQLGNCGIPTTAAAYSLNVTVLPITTLGYLTIWPTGEDQPLVSTMNSPDGRIKANAAIVPAGYQAAVSVFVTDTTNVILDIDGYFTAPGSGTYEFYPLTPCRLVDTRGADGELGGPRLVAQTPRSFPLLMSSCIPAGLNPNAYSLNFTVVPNPVGQRLGYLTVWPTGEPQPTVSTLNNPTATLVANAAIVPAGTGGAVDVYPSNTTDLLIDIDGYFAPPGTGGLSMYPAAPCRVLDTRQNNGPPFMGEKTVNVVGSACAPPSNAAAYIFNATVVPPGSMPYVTLWPNGEDQPTVSTLNALDGFITSNMAIVPTNNGSIDAYAAGLTQLLLDISGYFAP